MKKFLLYAALAGPLVFPPSASLAARRGAVAAQAVAATPVDVDQVQRLIQSIRKVLVLQPAVGNAAAIEANVLYTIDQSGATCAVTLAALRQARSEGGLSRSTQDALQIVLNKVSQCDPTGIAALGGGLAGQQLVQGPAVGVGGGSSNYTVP